MINSFWKQWEKTALSDADKILLIDAATGCSWTGQDITQKAGEFSEELSDFRRGEKVAFQLHGLTGIALFLALQKAKLVAIPLDMGMPKTGCWELAKNLQARAVYWHGELHYLSANATRDELSACYKITSGSHGKPAVVKCRASHLLSDGRQVIASMGLRPRDRHLAVIPLGHSYGLGNLVMPLILQGATIVYADRFVPRQLIDWINRYEISVFPGVPALFRSLASMPRGDRFRTLRLAISAGAPLHPEVARGFYTKYGVKIHNFYGASETGGISYDRTGSASLTGRSVGKPLNGVSVSIRKRKIVVKSPAVAASRGSFALRDVGKWNGRGELVLLGRLGEGANIGGKKVHPMEVETVLRALPSVSDAHVWVMRDSRREYLAAAVETNLSQHEIELCLEACLPTWKIPKCYWVAAELPRSNRGKVDGAALRRKFSRLVGE
jgi:acyl-CoA synthetase (AMP-forming)/AMP-acid ligase II